jgi:Fur family peroxide stress response transcriptional regulator
MEVFDEILQKAAQGFDGQIAGHFTYFYGTCKDCLDK